MNKILQNNKKLIRDYDYLIKSVAEKYTDIGKQIGLSEKELEKYAAAGLLTGNKHFSEAKANKAKYKKSTYLTWWIRRGAHKGIARKILSMAKNAKLSDHKNKMKLCENVLLDLMEEND